LYAFVKFKTWVDEFWKLFFVTVVVEVIKGRIKIQRAENGDLVFLV
jgi:hypothetical protein